jgi:glutamate synthase (NADPH/NADH) large chain
METVQLESVLSSSDQEKNIDRAIWHSVQRGGTGATDESILKGLIEYHAECTGSERAKQLLNDWSSSRSKFVKVFPNEYKRALNDLNAASTNGQKQVKVSA